MPDINRLKLCTIREIGTIEADIRLLITNRGREIAGVVWDPKLAPSDNLFSWYMRNRNTNWWPGYVERWGAEKAIDRDYVRRLERIIHLLNEGKTVAIACFCPDENRCHRSLVKRDVLRLMDGRPS